MAAGFYPASAVAADGVWRPNVTVAAVIERNGEYLLVEERAGDRLVVNQPAGHLEAGESLVEAVIRESREETGWEIRPTALVAVYQWVNPASGISILRFTFAATALLEHVGAALDEPIERILWTRPEALQQGFLTPRSPLVLRSIADYERGVRLPLDALSSVEAQ